MGEDQNTQTLITSLLRGLYITVLFAAWVRRIEGEEEEERGEVQGRDGSGAGQSRPQCGEEPKVSTRPHRLQTKP